MDIYINSLAVSYSLRNNAASSEDNKNDDFYYA